MNSITKVAQWLYSPAEVILSGFYCSLASSFSFSSSSSLSCSCLTNLRTWQIWAPVWGDRLFRFTLWLWKSCVRWRALSAPRLYKKASSRAITVPVLPWPPQQWIYTHWDSSLTICASLGMNCSKSASRVMKPSVHERKAWQTFIVCTSNHNTSNHQ